MDASKIEVPRQPQTPVSDVDPSAPTSRIPAPNEPKLTPCQMRLSTATRTRPTFRVGLWRRRLSQWQTLAHASGGALHCCGRCSGGKRGFLRAIRRPQGLALAVGDAANELVAGARRADSTASSTDRRPEIRHDATASRLAPLMPARKLPWPRRCPNDHRITPIPSEGGQP